MGLMNVLRKKVPEEEFYEDYEEDYRYEDEEDLSWQGERIQQARSIADVPVVLVSPTDYKDASKIADHITAMKMVMLNLADTEEDVARRLLDFVSGVVFSENGHIMKIAENVYAVAPYFVELHDLSGTVGRSDVYF